MSKKILEKMITDLAVQTLELGASISRRITKMDIEIDKLRNENYMLRKHLGVELVREEIEGEDKGLTIKKSK